MAQGKLRCGKWPSISGDDVAILFVDNHNLKLAYVIINKQRSIGGRSFFLPVLTVVYPDPSSKTCSVSGLEGKH
ncbi:hypothetical protein BC936DRAFT_149879 [Jimgerdemannia flammicorona]|uniref:Uncharacterized protein n=1 Tax=Jimgerdemannia flammicorona TaxID=994334 RepID=A0A433DJS8_9FUNG|nr:hypothetical protein BC936DRAFT_149879 [Jimgerdemannia flammicorona]